MRKGNFFEINLADIIQNVEKETKPKETLRMIEYLIPTAHQYIKSGLSCYQKGDYNEAIKQFQKALKLNPEKAEIHYNLGLTYQAKGLFDKAIEEYRKALELNPEDAEAHNNLGIIYYNQGSYQKAIEEFNHALSINPDFKIARKNLRLLEERE
jgi:tetratricopeptide (TPR) repeat protein